MPSSRAILMMPVPSSLLLGYWRILYRMSEPCFGFSKQLAHILMRVGWAVDQQQTFVVLDIAADCVDSFPHCSPLGKNN